MALAMPSRFAVLKIEDDDFRPVSSKNSKDKKKADAKQPGKKSEKVASTAGTTGASKKVNKQQPSKTQQKKEKKKKESAEQWEQWKQKDNELVDGTFEEDLHAAILQSKLDYEEKKDLYKQFKKEADQEKKVVDVPNGKKKKNKAMSLEQFKNMVSNTQGSYSKIDDVEEEAPNTAEDEQFFERIRSDTKEELTREFNKELTKEPKKEKVRKSFNNDTITIAQLQEKLDSLELENEKLKAELDKAKKEILSVKTRNKTLCGMLASGEMKDKADILMELEKHSRIKDELTEEVTRLNGLLEQERSRSKTGLAVNEVSSHSFHNNKHSKEHKEKNKKRSGNDITLQKLLETASKNY